MFKEAEGPTALRADLVRTLSFSVGVTDLETPEGYERCCSALAGVWNGRKGFVALLIRFLDRPVARRLVYPESLTSEADLDAAFALGLEFAESLGFDMDPPEFCGADPAVQARRLGAWDDIRRISQMPEVAIDLSPRPDDSLSGDRLDPPGAASEAMEPNTPATTAILAQLALVQKREDENDAPDPLVRLLSYF